MLSSFSHVQLFATSWTVAHQAPLSLGFSRQEYWSGSLSPPSRDLPNPGIAPTFLMSSALATGTSPLAPPGKPNITLELILFNVLGLVFLETHPPVLEIFLNYFFGYILPNVFFSF